MFCSKCGTKIEDGVKFCPSCGAAISNNKQSVKHQPRPQSGFQTIENNNMGKLLVSTKNSEKRKTVQLVCCVLEVIIGLFMLCGIGLIRDAFEDLLGSGTVGVVLSLVVGILCITYPIFIIIGNRSHCDVYENGVAGITGLSLNHPNSPMQKFSITYDEIINVAESNKTLYIYTQYVTYDVLAMENRSEALSEIKNRMSGTAN